ncbi:1-(5-phosphoribosyl)-5-[(5-phosphoribosylamino)methylideneamino]imidazole-4-carboxamide isomerase [Ruminococcaceae bacterium OttesenSCG-928-O06]|nr:1-(5-phosphoribosyl)-5-[(5-phosphoribosylamino)methylideneamino]imidazole-4-carboxamide isomerase [Ruminococcaceae bacterium OttesenSCG-928-O06]
MEIFPAIDMLGGGVVRLFQGDYTQKTQYGDDPLAYARRFEQQGATCLHLVDLDGAKEGAPRNFAAVRHITEGTGLFVELGGGIRNAATVEACFAAGVGRVILGTAALKAPAFTREMVEKYPEKVAIGVDARDGKVAVEGWLSTSDADSVDFCHELQNIGVKYIIYTDISRDGAQKGANLKVYETLAGIEGVCFTASGGVSTLADIAALRQMGLYAAILGKALYENTLSLPEALTMAKGKPPRGKEGL